MLPPSRRSQRRAIARSLPLVNGSAVTTIWRARFIRNVDRATHLKIVVLGLLLATVAVGLTLAIPSSSKAAFVESMVVLKAKSTVTAANSSAAIVS